MKANKDGIGLEAAKTLKDCGIKAANSYSLPDGGRYSTNFIAQDKVPAYTWSEILIKHAKEFFGEEDLILEEIHTANGIITTKVRASSYYSVKILHELQSENYEKAEQIFIENCILINKK